MIGFRRIETLVTLMREQAQTLYASEDATAAAETLLRPQSVLVSAGRILSRDQAQRRSQILRELVDELDASLDKLADEAEREYKWRNRTFLFGVVLLVLARILPAYL